ncbi:YdiU family protein [Pseudohalioglobus sediminis]|uniref:Protein nucleotidyltransferase YdiU n=1 Tax=Pseudohalioglobus sediminis TaxID=2606449 RepID=A0A5B0WR36_9GAMM|nr:YdiU family protein [Pseudohalioglobus sediminis]KAA1189492.1 YdiU family protein [Pseudohalioglobus sediminis]
MQPIPFDNTFARLPDQFYTRLAPTPVTRPGLVRVNRPLAQQLGIDAQWLVSPEGVACIAGNQVPAGAEPLAAVYAGHQFGSYNPQLGDGRALLLGEVIDRQGRRFDIQLKGSGPTPYSRGGDGRSPLGPVLREYIVSEAMHALGVPTTRALAAVTTGERVMRDMALPGAVLARVAASHIRIGSFQFFAARGDQEALQALVAHCLQRHYPEQADSDNPALALLQAVIGAQAKLISRWQLLGFIHGVMNTDNMLICGETVDYGPCAFIDDFNPNKVFSSIDHGGRYAYRNQPAIAHWNLAVLAQSLLPVLAADQDRAVALAQEAVDAFPALFEAAHLQGLAAKLGLAEIGDADKPLVDELFQLMSDGNTDFTLTFRRLYDHANGPARDVGKWFELPDSFIPWLSRWRQRLERDYLAPETREQRMRRANPAVIPRNHRVEEAIRAAEDEADFSPFHTLVDRLADPFELDADDDRLLTPPTPQEVVQRTFCGT